MNLRALMLGRGLLQAIVPGPGYLPLAHAAVFGTGAAPIDTTAPTIVMFLVAR